MQQISKLTKEVMGLDMYAHRRLYVKQYDYQGPEERYTVQIARGGKPVPGIQSDRISVVEEEVMIWHKANHIHGWFVDNVMNGKDPNDGNTYYVSENDLQKLLDTCEKVIQASMLVRGSVLVSKVWNSFHGTWDERREPGRVIENASVAQGLLPTTEGSFFGKYDYDEDYWDTVRVTRDWASRMLADSKAGVPGEIYYSSSW